MKAFQYVDARSIDAAIQALPADASMDDYGRKVMLKAGGIDLLDQMKERMIEPDTLVNMKPTEEALRYIRAEGAAIHIGPLTKMAELAGSALVRERYPALADAAGHAATPQIRAVATVGGNICQRPRCWYFRNAEFNCLKKGGDVCFAKEGENQYHAIFGDGPSFIVHPSNIAGALMAAGAEFVVRGRDGERTVRAEDFFVRPEQNVMVENVLKADEILSEIRVPGGIRASAHYEIREKQSYDWPLVAATAAQNEAGWQIVLGAVAPIPWRARAAEAALGNRAMTAALANQAAERAIAGAAPLRYNRYKLDLVKVAVRRALLEAAGMEATA
jgi:xanthine dehydrogenase YagS FAD-binding subunit